MERRRKSKTFDTRAAARAWANSIEASGLRGTQHTLEQAYKRYIKEVSPTHKGERWEVIRLNKLCKDPLAFISFENLKAGHIAAWRDRRLKEVKPASVNRELNLISQVINTAIKEWGWCEVNPITKIRRPKATPPRSRVITDEERDAFIEACPHRQVAIAVLFALETAMRRSEICAIKPSMVQGAVVVLPDSKNGLPRAVPLSKRAIELLEKVDNQFTVSPAIISRTFKRVCDDIGLVNCTFHDTRHTALTRLAQKVHILDLMRISGHSDTKMLNVYYNPDPSDIASRLG